jgi:phosphopantothenoylcysteine decarboxylase/phosphopantothenate--cysteine ligase
VTTLSGKRILLIIGGGVAAYKSLDLARRLMERGASVRGILTKAGAEFITPLSVASLTGDQCFTDLFSLKDEAEMGHIRLSREADLIVIAPATADLMAKMANGLANDLASTVLLATDKPVMTAPAMNAQMWAHPATMRNIKTLQGDGIYFVGPNAGTLACGEIGAGRLAEVPEILDAIETFFNADSHKPLDGKHIILTAGPTHEPIDPVRYIANRSSGKQGFELAAALATLGAQVSLIAGPTQCETPFGVNRIDVETAREMHDAVHKTLPADAAIFVAAVADWHIANEGAQKMKKNITGLPTLNLVENPDILASVAQLKSGRPELVIGFAAETENIVEYAAAKRTRKACDWIVANDVSKENGVMGGNENQIHLITKDGSEAWPRTPKEDVAIKLAELIAKELS